MEDKVSKEIEVWIQDEGSNVTHEQHNCFLLCRVLAYCTDVIVNALNEQTEAIKEQTEATKKT